MLVLFSRAGLLALSLHALIQSMRSRFLAGSVLALVRLALNVLEAVVLVRVGPY